jgi:hypothetical protein
MENTEHPTSNIQHPTSNIERRGKDAHSHTGAKAEGRMKNAEKPGKAT